MGNKEITRRLKSMEDLRRFLADTVNKLNQDKIDPSKASKIGYLLQILARIIEGSDLEKRLSELEKQFSKKGKSN